MDHLSRSLTNTFTAQPLDRAAHGRKDVEWLSVQLNHPDARFLLLNDHKVLTTEQQQPLIISQAQFQTLKLNREPALLGLGQHRDVSSYPVFKVNCTDPEQQLAPLLGLPPFADLDSYEALPLRALAHHTDNEIASLCAYASILNHWHETTRYCPRCGSPLQQKEGGVVQQCQSESCRHVEFPRINSAVIMRITHQDRILLARQETWPEKRFSVLAGFVEVGETLEAAVQREVFEEVRVRVEKIEYQSSQPWPFPNSLMLGYAAEAVNTDVALAQDDIAEAQWLTAQQLRQSIEQGSLLPPSKLSISYRLIDDWFTGQTGQALSVCQPPTTKPE